jgi:hypothetical protein
MKIGEFIQATVRERADKAGALVVYDPAQRYRNRVLKMGNEQCTVLDASESFVEAHERAVQCWAGLGMNDSDLRPCLETPPGGY